MADIIQPESRYTIQLKSSIQNILSYRFYFTDIKRDYIIDLIIPNAHGSYISGLIELNNGSLLTSCKKDFLMKIFQKDDLGNGYKEKIQKKGICGCLLYYEETNRILSGEFNGIISIYEEKEPKAKPKK